MNRGDESKKQRKSEDSNCAQKTVKKERTGRLMMGGARGYTQPNTDARVELRRAGRTLKSCVKD